MSLRRLLRGRAPAPKSRANQGGEPSEEAATRKSRTNQSGKPSEEGSTRTFRPEDLPEAESPLHRFDLQGHTGDKNVWRVAVLPGGARIVTGCDDGHIRVFDARGGGDPLLDIPAHAKWGPVAGLAVLDDHVLASTSYLDKKLHTWDARTGERMETIDVGGTGAPTLAAVGPKTLVAGLFGPVVFIQHTCGRQLAEVARDKRAHSEWIYDIAWHEEVMVTACHDKTARVWSLSKRKPLAVLRGHRESVWCAAVNSRYIATGSADRILRLYTNGAGFPLVFVLDGLHANLICTVKFIGSDLIISGSDDGTMCFTAVSPDARPIARLRTHAHESNVSDTAITVDGHVAWGGWNGTASVCAPPRAVADAAKEHALVQHEPPPPLQGALVDAHAGRNTAGDACRTLLNAERCSASISEWCCGHKLLMLAIERGEVAADCGLEVDGVMVHDYWFKNMYLPTKRVTLGAQDRRIVDQCLAEAKEAGVIEGTQAILVAIEAQLDLQEEVTGLQDAGRQMLMALSIALLDQASTRAELKRMRRAQTVSVLLNAVFSVVPLGGGAAAGAGVAVFGMAPDLFEGILSCGVGLQGAATPPLVDKFVRHTALVIACWETVSVEARQSIREAAEGLGMTWEEFCDMIVNANKVLQGKGGRKVGENALDGVVVEEKEDDVGGGSDEGGVLDGSEHVGSMLTLNMGRTEANGEEGEAGDDRQTRGRNRGPQESKGEENASDAERGETNEANLIHSASEVGSTVLPTNRRLSMRELESLALNADEVRRLSEKQTSSLLAAAMDKFNDEHAKHCVVIERAIVRAFDRSFVDGEALIDTLAVPEVLEIAMEALNMDNEYLAMRATARRVLQDRLSSYVESIPRRS